MESPWLECSESLRTAISNVATFPISRLSGEELVECLADLQAMRSSLDAIVCRALSGSVSAELLAGETGHRSVSAVVSAETGSNPRSLRADQHLGSWLVEYPIIDEAFSDGRISKDHVRAIKARENPRTRAFLPESQGYLVEAATNCCWPEFLVVLRYWDLAADPDGDEPMEQVAARSLNYTLRSDGTVTGRFSLDPLAGHAFTTAVEQRTQGLFRDDAESGSLRTAGQRRADALVELVATSGTRQPGSPLMHVVMGEQIAASHFRALADNRLPPRLPLDPEKADGRCELIDGTPIHPHLALATVAAAEFRRLVMKPNGECTDLGRRARGFPAHLKEALLVRARGRCQHPGCDAPVSWMQADHLLPWSRGGCTALDNGQILCDPHNKKKRDRSPPSSPPDDDGLGRPR